MPKATKTRDFSQKFRNSSKEMPPGRVGIDIQSDFDGSLLLRSHVVTILLRTVVASMEDKKMPLDPPHLNIFFRKNARAYRHNGESKRKRTSPTQSITLTALGAAPQELDEATLVLEPLFRNMCQHRSRP